MADRQRISALSAQPSPGGQHGVWMLPDDARIVGVIADSIERGKLDHPGFYRNTQLGEVLRRVLSAALAARQPVGEPVELSPEFTDTARAAIAWVLWHHQGGSSAVGQPLRFALGMGQHDRMTDQQIAEAKRFATWAGVSSEGFQHRSPALAVDHQAALLAEERSHSETIDQRDRCEEVADELADHIARITGVDIGEHSSVNCPWQNAIDAAEEYKPAQAVDLDQFRPAVCAMGLYAEDPQDVDEAKRLMDLIDSKAVGNG